MLSQLYLEEGAIVPKHSHENEQLTYVLEGRMRFWFGDDESQVVEWRRRGAGDPALAAPPGAALERTVDVDVFCPPRQDWLDGTDATCAARLARSRLRDLGPGLDALVRLDVDEDVGAGEAVADRAGQLVRGLVGGLERRARANWRWTST